MGSRLKYSDLLSGRGLGGGLGGRDGGGGWTGGGALRLLGRTCELGDGGLAAGCLGGGGGGKVLFLSSDIVGGKREADAVSWAPASAAAPGVQSPLSWDQKDQTPWCHGLPRLDHVRLAFNSTNQQSLCAFISSRFRLCRMAEPQRNRPSGQWIHTVRAGMASDNSRTWFDAKVQEHGFDFLDDYLDRILAQAKQPQSVAPLCLPRHPTHISKAIY